MKSFVTCQRGVVAAEMAVILPIVLLLLLGLMEGGRILGAWVILTNEAREAARYGAVTDYSVDCSNGTTITSWTTSVTNFVTSNVGQMLDTSTLTVTPTLDCSTGIPTSSQVQLGLTMTTITPLVQAVLPTVTMGTTSIMRAE